MASEITGISTACSTVCSGANQTKHQNPVSLAFVRGIHRWPMNSLHKRPVPRKMFPFDDVIMSKHIAPFLQMPDYAVPSDGLFMQFYDSFDRKTSQCRGSDSSWLCDTAFVSIDLNTLRPRQSGRHLADDIFKCIFMNENVWIVLKISLEFVPKVQINNIPALVQIMASRRPGDKPIAEPMMVNLLTHICVTRPQWVNAE